jgi:hypothetical protein
LAASIALFAILTSFILCGCGMAEQYMAQQNLDQSQAEYERCTALNGGDSAQCEAAHTQVESSEKTLEQTSNGVSPAAPGGRHPLQFRTNIDLDSPEPAATSDTSEPANPGPQP